MSRDRAFRVVADFEAALCEFTGAPFAVTVDSCSNAIYLALRNLGRQGSPLRLPARTYVGVVHAARNAGYSQMVFTDERWDGSYLFRHGDPDLSTACPPRVVDSAKRFERGMYKAGTFTCVSFQAGKLLPIGRGGAILHDDPKSDEWFRRARLDGRTAGADYQENRYQLAANHMYMTPPDAARGLWLMTYLEDDDQGDYTEYPNLAEATWV